MSYLDALQKFITKNMGENGYPFENDLRLYLETVDDGGTESSKLQEFRRFLPAIKTTPFYLEFKKKYKINLDFKLSEKWQWYEGETDYSINVTFDVGQKYTKLLEQSITENIEGKNPEFKSNISIYIGNDCEEDYGLELFKNSLSHIKDTNFYKNFYTKYKLTLTVTGYTKDSSYYVDVDFAPLETLEIIKQYYNACIKS